MALGHHKFVNRAITDLLITEVVCKMYSLPKVVNPLSVSVNSTGKERLIKYLTLTICKYQGVKEAKVYAANKKHCYKLDLRHGYHHIDMHLSSQKYLGFSWLENNIANYHTFTSLPFGLSSACFIFTTITRRNVWRSKGFLIVVYQDDGLGFADSEESYNYISGKILTDLLSVGFLSNYEKKCVEATKEFRVVRFCLKSGQRYFICARFKNEQYFDIFTIGS